MSRQKALDFWTCLFIVLAMGVYFSYHYQTVFGVKKIDSSFKTATTNSVTTSDKEKIYLPASEKSFCNTCRGFIGGIEFNKRDGRIWSCSYEYNGSNPSPDRLLLVLHAKEKLCSNCLLIMDKMNAEFWKNFIETLPSNEDLRSLLQMDAPAEGAVKVAERLLQQRPSKEDLLAIIKANFYQPNFEEPVELKINALEELMKFQPSNEDFRGILRACCNNETVLSEVSERLMQQQPSNNDLCDIVRFGPDEWKAKAAEQALKLPWEDFDYRWILYCAPEEWQVKAWEQLMKQQLSNSNLCCIMRYASDKWAAKAWELLLKQGPEKVNLRTIITYSSEEWQIKAAELLLEGQVSNSDLCHIISDGSNQTKDKACERLMSQQPTNSELAHVLFAVREEWKVKICEQLMKQAPSNRELGDIILYAPEEWKAKAQAILKSR